jgi:hypothetical protein
VNKRRAVLEILRDAERSLSTAECAAKFAVRLGLDEDDPRLGQIANRRSPRVGTASRLTHQSRCTRCRSAFEAKKDDIDSLSHDIVRDG